MAEKKNPLLTQKERTQSQNLPFDAHRTRKKRNKSR